MKRYTEAALEIIKSRVRTDREGIESAVLMYNVEADKFYLVYGPISGEAVCDWCLGSLREFCNDDYTNVDLDCLATWYAHVNYWRGRLSKLAAAFAA